MGEQVGARDPALRTAAGVTGYRPGALDGLLYGPLDGLVDTAGEHRPKASRGCRRRTEPRSESWL